MPYKPKRPCSQRDCPELVEIGEQYCPGHKKEDSRRYERDRRSPIKRAFYASKKWRLFRKVYIRKHPWCESGIHDIPVRSTDLDHIVKFVSDLDPLAWSEDNLQALCKRCHSSKSAKEGRWGK